MAQTKKKQPAKKKVTQTITKPVQKKTIRQPVALNTQLKKHVTLNMPKQERVTHNNKAFYVTSKQLQRVESHIATLQAEIAETRSSLHSDDIEAQMQTIERNLESRLEHLDERVDTLQAHLLDLEERLEDETTGQTLRARDLDESLDDS